MATMKVCRFVAAEKKVEIAEVPAPLNPKPGHVTVKVAYAGTCGSTLQILDGTMPAKDGVVLGLEFSGVIHKVGEGVVTLKLGDRVAVNPFSACNGCRYCHRGRANMCTAYGVDNMLSFERDGGWAEYCEVPARDAVVLPESLSLKNAVLSEPISCILNTWSKMGYIPADARVLVMGAGNAGLQHASMFHFRGYRDITITSRAEERRKLAKNLGLGLKVSTLHEVSERYGNVENLDSEGFDVVVDTTGSQAALETALTLLRRCGKMILYGIANETKAAKIPVIDILFKEIQIISAICAGNTFADAVAILDPMTKAQYLNFDKLGYRMFKLDEASTALELMRNREISKPVFEF